MKLIYCLILLSFSFSQTSTSSLNGFGSYVNRFDASAIGMGDTKLFSGFSARANFSSSSSFLNSPFSNLIMSIAYFLIKYKGDMFSRIIEQMLLKVVLNLKI